MLNKILPRFFSSRFTRWLYNGHIQRCFSQSTYNLPLNMHGIVIRNYRSNDVAMVNALIQSETWNTSVNDLSLGLLIDPNGGFVAETKDGKIIGSSYCCNVDNEESIGLYCIVKPELRKLGLGKILYDVVVQHIEGRNFTFTSVPKMVDIYEMVGQKTADYLRRFVGKLKLSSSTNKDLRIVEFDKGLMNKVLDYESSICNPAKPEILEKWLKLETNLSLICLKDDQVCGYGVICDSMAWPRIAPLLADDLEIMQLLLEHLNANFVPSNYRGISFSFSEQHTECLELMTRLEMKEIRRFPYHYSAKDKHQHHSKIYARLLWQYTI